MVRLRGDIHGQAASAIRLCALVGALVGATLHDAEHAFDEGDVSCTACLHADRPDCAATTAPSIPRTPVADAIVDLRQVVAVVPLRIAKEHGPRAPPFIG